MSAGRIRSFAGSWAICALACALLTACGGGGSAGSPYPTGGGSTTFTVGGTVKGLTAPGLVLQLNGGENVSVASGATDFTFSGALVSGSNYAVTVATQPAGQTCTVAQGSGTVGTANITSISVSCSANAAPTYTVGGTVGGLTSSGLTLALNGGNTVQVASGSANFTFTTTLSSGSNYVVTVAAQPVGETCTVAQGAGTVGASNVDTVVVSCTLDAYTIGGTVSGLMASGLQLALNGGNDLSIPSGASGFTFASALASGSSYSVTVATQPIGETCTVAQGSGAVGTSNVDSVGIACSVETFSVSGTVSNLSTAGLSLRDSVGGETLAVPAGASTFRFAQMVPYGTDIAVTVTGQPAWQTCTTSASNFAGPIHSNVTAESISCTTVTASVSTLAGSTASGSQDGVGVAATFFHPDGIAVDAAGNAYVADEYNDLIRRVSPAGVVSTLAGTAGVAGSTDGAGTSALFNHPQAVAVDSTGAIYVADTFNDEIRKIVCAGTTASTCTVSTLAGSTTAGHADGMGTAASFNHPEGIAVDALGNVYVADSLNNEIREITPTGLVTTVAGSTVAGNVDGAGTSAEFNFPAGIAIDSAGSIYVADYNNNEIREIGRSEMVSTLAGSGVSGDANGLGAAASFWGPMGVAVDSAGNVYVTDSFNNQIRLITPGGAVSTFTGSTRAGSTDGPLTSALFNDPIGIATNVSGDVYIGDYGNNEIRQIAP